MRVRAGKLRPPSPPQPLIARPRLDPLALDVLSSRLTLVTGGAGAGKTTLAASWSQGVRSAWYSTGPEDAQPVVAATGLAAALAGVLPELDTSELVDQEIAPGPAPGGAGLELRAAAVGAALADAVDLAADGEPLLLVLDDVGSALPGCAAVVDALVQQAPPGLCVVVLARVSPGLRLARLRAAGQVHHIGSEHLAFTVEETAALLSQVCDAADAAQDVVTLTGGWPALVRLAAEALRGTGAADRPRVLAGLARPGSSVAQYLVEEVLQDSHTPGPQLRRLAALGPFRAAAADALGLGERLDELVGRGLVRPVRADLLVVPELVAGAVSSCEPLEERERAELLERSAQWYAAAGDPQAALAAAARARDGDALVRLLAGPAFGSGPTTAASADALVQALRAAGLTGRREVAGVEGQARQLLGDWDGALRCYTAAAGTNRVPASLAWRIALVHVYRRDLDAAVDIWRRADGEQARTVTAAPRQQPDITCDCGTRLGASESWAARHMVPRRTRRTAGRCARREARRGPAPAGVPRCALRRHRAGTRGAASGRRRRPTPSLRRHS
jgi:hypothetical protein